MKRPLTWLLVACGTASAITLGFALSTSPVRILDVMVRGWLVLASVFLLAMSGTGSTGAFASRSRIIASQAGLLSLVALGTFVLLRGRQPWPGVVLLGAAAVIEGVLVFQAARARRATHTR